MDETTERSKVKKRQRNQHRNKRQRESRRKKQQQLARMTEELTSVIKELKLSKITCVKLKGIMVKNKQTIAPSKSM